MQVMVMEERRLHFYLCKCAGSCRIYGTLRSKGRDIDTFDQFAGRNGPELTRNAYLMHVGHENAEKLGKIYTIG